MNRREVLLSTMGAAAVVASPAALAQAGGRNATLRDARRLQDSMLLVDGLDPSGLTERYLGMLEAAGVDVWHQSMGGFASFVNLLHFCDKYSDRIVQVKSVRDMRQAWKDGKVGHLSGWQSANTLIDEGGGSSVLPAIGNLRGYRELGLRVCGLVYNVTSSFGGGAVDPQAGLTRAGKRLVEEIHKERILLDVGGHTSEQTSFDALEISTGVPVTCSHTNLRAKVDNERNMTDRLIERVAATGGVIGLTVDNDFHARTRHDGATPVTPQVGLEKHLDQYDYLKKLVGVDHISFGPDFMFDRPDLVEIIPELWPADIYSNNPPWFMVKDIKSISDLPNVTLGLMQRGWTDAELRKVFSENLLRVYEKVWGA
ncbi:MAG: membrane dipeptidase [Pseudomonadota bacterium]|jgi:membrane dipeptidase